MQQADLEREKKRANEELAMLLTELVIEPVEARVKALMQEQLYEFERRLEEKLKKQFSVVGKTRDLESQFTGLADSLENLGTKFRGQFEVLSDSIEGRLERAHAGILDGHSDLRQVIEQLDAMCKEFGQKSEHSFSDLRVWLSQSTDELQRQILLNEEKQLERTGQLQEKFEDMPQLLVTGHQRIDSLISSLSQKLSALLEQNRQGVEGMQRIQELTAHQQLMVADQQKDIQRLRYLFIRALWSGSGFGIFILCSVAFLKFY